jgi:hypothetical protein
MQMLRRMSDRVLARLVPEMDAGACKEYYRCQNGRQQVCYVSCGRPVFCRNTGRSCGGCRGC